MKLFILVITSLIISCGEDNETVLLESEITSEKAQIEETPDPSTDIKSIKILLAGSELPVCEKTNIEPVGKFIR